MKNIGLLLIVWVLQAKQGLALTRDVNFEPNNDAETAQPILINDRPQQHYFNYQGDEDWFVFYAQKGMPYDIQILNGSVGAGINPAFEIYNSKGELEIATFDFGFSGEGELFSWTTPPQSDFYYIRVFNQETSFSTDAGYQIKIFLPFAHQYGLVKGKVLDNCNQQGISKANISVNTNYSILSHKDGSFGLELSPGEYELLVQGTNYTATTQTATVTEFTATPLDFILNPLSECSEPVETPIANPDEAVAVYDTDTEMLTVRDVRVGDGIMSAELKNIGNFQFQLISTAETVPGTEAPAYYDSQTLKAQFPKVFAFDTYYRLELKNVGDWLFVIDAVEVYSE